MSRDGSRSSINKGPGGGQLVRGGARVQGNYLKIVHAMQRYPFYLTIPLTGCRGLGLPQLVLMPPQRQVEGPEKPSKSYTADAGLQTESVKRGAFKVSHINLILLCILALAKED